MFIIAGLGNPGFAYSLSRHNAGFRALDLIAAKLNIKISRRQHFSLLGEGFYASEKLILAKPQTYMNLSGRAVEALLSYYKLEPSRLIVLFDDIDLPIGNLRVRASGSAGTHNGMRSIIASLNGEQGFSRVRIGVGKQRLGGDLAAHVLGRPKNEEQALLDEAQKNAAEAALLIVTGNLAQAQAKFNRHTQIEQEQE
ncbi:MAG TPA: aminoacyl-tRNA hydrolase [Clostridia bacterium]|nr:aminoacyl-tRNA hydrolase [Clostridia bacterium]